MCKFFDNNRGMSLIELVVTMVILSILAGLILPSAKLASTRTKELELRRSLREIRTALDEYHKEWVKASEGKPEVIDDHGYPETLEVLVEGKDFGGLSKTPKKFLRRIPKDPFDPDPTDDVLWGMRAYEDEPDSSTWGGKDVFDVYSQSEATAIDGTKYKDW